MHSLLGNGASGAVFEVSDQGLDQVGIALKLLHPHLIDDEKILNRFRSQVLLARQLSHPNIVQVFDFDSDEENNHFITMELVPGRSLQSFLKENGDRPLPFSEALLILSDVAKALAYAHSRGIVHRDLKPSNILISFEGEVKLSDFGLVTGLESSLGLTQTGELLGTPAYMAPEQFSNCAGDARSDVYSFGILAYQLTHGSLPFGDLPYLSQANAHLSRQFPSVTKTREQHLPLWFEDFLAKCCEKNPEDRYSTANALVTMIGEHLPESEHLHEKSLRFSFLRKSPQNRLRRKLRFAGTILTLLLLVILFVSSRQSSTRRFVGSHLLRAEKFLGFELRPLKALFQIRVSLAHPEAFLEMVSKGDLSHANVQAYLRAGGRIDLKDEEGNGMMHLALGNPETHVLRDLHEAGADIDERNSRGETPLLHAIRLRYSLHVSELLADHADPNLCDHALNCPIQLAAKLHDSILLLELLKRGANVTLTNAEGRNVLHECAKELEATTLSYLVNRSRAGIPVIDSRDAFGLTPLMYAVQTNTPERALTSTIEFLIFTGANLSARDNLGRTALLLALQMRNPRAIQLLLAGGADPHDRDASGKSAAQYAKEAGLETLHPAWATP